LDRSITVSVVCADILDFAADVVVLKYANGLHGADAAAYERLGRAGAVLTMPKAQEWIAVNTSGALRAPHLIFIGVGSLYGFEYPKIREFSRTAISAVGQALKESESIAITLHGPGYGLDEMEAFDAEVAGLVDGIRMGLIPPRLLRVSIVERDSRRAERLASRLREVLPNNSISIQSVGEMQRSVPATSETIRNAGYETSKKRRAFVAMPFRPEMDDAYDYGIFRPANECGYVCERADRELFTDDVVQWIKDRITSADIVIADVTGANPNVYLEVGYAWGLQRRTMLVSRSSEDLKFDLKSQRCFVYKTIKELENHVKAVLTRFAN
jgi:hypothetical protein